MGALVGGHLDVVAATTPNLLPYLESGRIRVIAIAADERLQGVFAKAPTWKEQGIDYVSNGLPRRDDRSQCNTCAKKPIGCKRCAAPPKPRNGRTLSPPTNGNTFSYGPEATSQAIRSQVASTHALLDELGLLPANAQRLAQAGTRPARSIRLFENIA